MQVGKQYLLYRLQVEMGKDKNKEKKEKKEDKGTQDNDQPIDFASILGNVAEQKASMSPENTMRAISMIFSDPNQEQQPDKRTHFSPQARIILLTILLICTVLGMYTIFESFLDTIILAVLTGVAYVRLRQRFVVLMKKTELQQSPSRTFSKHISNIIFYGAVIMVIALLPWLRSQFSDEVVYESWSALLMKKVNSLTYLNVMAAFPKSNSVIKLIQLYLALQIVTDIFGNALHTAFFKIKKYIGECLFGQIQLRRKSRNKAAQAKINSCLHHLFFILFLLMFLLMIVVTAGIFFQFSSMVGSAGRAIQRYNNCTFYDLDNDSTNVEQCTQVITGTLKPYLPNIQQQKEVTNCMNQIQSTEQRYLNFTLLQHKKEICLVYQIVKEYSPQVIDHFFDIAVTKEYLLSIFKNLLKLLSLTSDTIFSITTFISILMVTVKSYSAAQSNFYIFGQHQNQLLGQITTLISDCIMVTAKHIIFSLALFEIFRFSQFNIILSLVIGTVSLFPLISTTFVMVLFSISKYYLNRDENQMVTLSTVICLVLFYVGSGRIYKNNFSKIDFNNTLISLSAVFGLYRFPVAGVFYGPLVILLFRCAYDALGRSKV